MSRRVYLREYTQYQKRAECNLWSGVTSKDILKDFPYLVPVCQGSNTTLALEYQYKDDFMIISYSNEFWYHLSGGWFKNPQDAVLFRMKFPESM